MKAAIGYIRVSTLTQAEEGVSLEAQREKIKAYCRLHDLDLLSVESDDLSGKRADNRPGLQRAINLACRQKAVICVYSLSRFARSTKDCIELSERLRRSGADLASITEKIDTASAMGEFFFTIIAALAQLERKQISERTSLAMHHLKQQNRRISGFIPYGFANGGITTVTTANGKQKQVTLLKPNATEQATVADMVHRRQQGDSYRAIAASLNDTGVAPRAGAKWYASTVRYVLSRQ